MATSNTVQSLHDRQFRINKYRYKEGWFRLMDIHEIDLNLWKTYEEFSRIIIRSSFLANKN